MRRKFDLILLILFFSLGWGLFAQSDFDLQTLLISPNFEYCYRAVFPKVDVRKSPGFSGKLLFKLDKDDEIFVDEQKTVNGWFFCFIPKYNEYGYCLDSNFVLKPYFEDVVPSLINDQPGIVFMIQRDEVLPCQSVTSLIQHQLQNVKSDKALFVVKTALQNGGSMIHKNDVSNPLIESVKLNDLTLTEFLLNNGAGAFINERARQFAPPLYYAIKNGNEKMVELLLKYGADSDGVSYNKIPYKTHVADFVKKGILSEKRADTILNLLKKPEE